VPEGFATRSTAHQVHCLEAYRRSSLCYFSVFARGPPHGGLPRRIGSFENFNARNATKIQQTGGATRKARPLPEDLRL
jgi:hypothetical protein